jgi:hypothetical protein
MGHHGRWTVESLIRPLSVKCPAPLLGKQLDVPMSPIQVVTMLTLLNLVIEGAPIQALRHAAAYIYIRLFHMKCPILKMRFKRLYF